jgi:hypothetical protein
MFKIGRHPGLLCGARKHQIGHFKIALSSSLRAGPLRDFATQAQGGLPGFIAGAGIADDGWEEPCSVHHDAKISNVRRMRVAFASEHGKRENHVRVETTHQKTLVPEVGEIGF